MLLLLGVYGACFSFHILLVGDDKLTIDIFEQRFHMVELNMNINPFWA
jgi:hypothetical protein